MALNADEWFGVAGIAVGSAAILVSYLLHRSTMALLEPMSTAVAGVERQVQRVRKDVRGLNTGAPAGLPRATTPAQTARDLQRKQAQDLRERKFQWQKTKDVAKAIRYVLDKLDEDD